MEKNYLYIFYIFSILIIKSKEEDNNCIYSFHCKTSNKNNNICLEKIRTNSPSIFNIILNSNFNNSLSCDVNSAFVSETPKIIESKNKNENFLRPSYLNGYCENNSQCLIGICKKNKCISYSKCISHEHCPINTFCSNGNCIPLLEENSNCKNSYQCKFNLFCSQKELKCKKLFSVGDNIDISKIKDNSTNLDEICKSGGYFKDNNIICRTLYNVNYQCDENICKYKYIYNGRNIIKEINQNCLCGYNRHRKKNCILGNGEQDYIEFLKIRKDFLFNENYIKKCHTLERDSKEICNELINTDKSVYFRKYVQKYNNLKIKALEFHRIKDSEPCVKNVIFGYDTNLIIPNNQKCPKYSCNSSLPICLLGINPFTENGNDITISLNSEICSINENCVLSNSGIITSNDILEIMSKEKITGTCSIYSYWPSVRYPGELCNIDSDCISSSLCKNGKCTGINEGENCTETSECLVGYFCNKDTMKCTKQKKEGETCKEGWDCLNFLGCYKGRCIKLGILKPGVINNEITSPFPGNDRRDLLCTTGEMDWDLGYCVETRYSEDWIKRYGKNINNGFIKCDYGEFCYYDNGKKNVPKDCGCGYNSDGQGYCPLPNNMRSDKWKERIKNIANFAKNDCHSLSRFDCYLQNSIEDLINKRKYDKETINAHLFYNAVPCAEKMFSFNKYIKVNFYFLFILFYILKF